ncbi:MAG: hypothetical protein JWQ04_2247 [Pedosphaera sp.]|nr:hypothetical protein [Pedosphaera sp.]
MVVSVLAAFSCGAGTFTVSPIADAFVTPGASGSLSSSNFGNAGALAIAASGLPQGEFQSVIKFDLSSVRSSLDAQYGAGLWSVQSVTLQLTATPHNNAIFNNIAAGHFGISLMQNNSWVEGTGTGGVPSSDGISFTTLQGTYINNATDQALGTFSFAGGTSGANTYSLNLTSGIINDLVAGDDLSLRLSAADSQVSYLFGSRSGGAVTQPILTVTAVPEPDSRSLLAMGSVTFFLWWFGKRKNFRNIFHFRASQ